MTTSNSFSIRLSSIFLAGFILLFISCGDDLTEPHDSLVIDLNEYEQQIEQELVELISAYQLRTGIQIYYKSSSTDPQSSLQRYLGWMDSEYVYQNEENAEILENVKVLIELLDEFPDKFLSEIELKHIFLMSSHRLNWSGLALKDVDNYLVAFNKEGIKRRSTIAHELFHIFDPEVSITVSVSDTIPEWELLNPSGFEYGDGCEYTSELDTYSEGFLSAYSRCAAHEDRAVLFSYMYTDMSVITPLVENDDYLKAKVAYITKVLSDYDFTF